jgi:hypothetical protein
MLDVAALMTDLRENSDDAQHKKLQNRRIEAR